MGGLRSASGLMSAGFLRWVTAGVEWATNPDVDAKESKSAECGESISNVVSPQTADFPAITKVDQPANNGQKTNLPREPLSSAILRARQERQQDKKCDDNGQKVPHSIEFAQRVAWPTPP